MGHGLWRRLGVTEYVACLASCKQNAASIRRTRGNRDSVKGSQGLLEGRRMSINQLNPMATKARFYEVEPR
jgi:hypothetical protein